MVVGGGVGGGPEAPVVNHMLLQKQQVPQQIAPLPLQMPPPLHRAQQQQHQQMILRQLLCNVQGHPGGLLRGPPT